MLPKCFFWAVLLSLGHPEEQGTFPKPDLGHRLVLMHWSKELTGIPICTLQFVNSPTLYIPGIKETPQELEEQELVLYKRRRHSIVILKNVIYFQYSDPWPISTEENTGPSCCRSCFRHVLHKYSEDVFGWQQLSSGTPGHTEAQLKAATSSSELIHCYGQNSTNRPNNWDVAIPISE